MKKDHREIQINGKEELYKLERFIEEICDYHNINNEYFGNILLASTEAASILISVSEEEKDPAVLIAFDKTVKGFTFKIKFEGQVREESDEKLLELKIRKHKLDKEIFIVKALADEVIIAVNGEAITLTFFVSSMNYEKSLIRINTLKEYWIGSKKIVNKGNE